MLPCVLDLRNRDKKGTATAEFPVALSILLIFILFPLIDLATLWFGASSVHNAARVAAIDAARAPSFVNNSGSTQSATNVAKRIATSQATGGVSITSDDVVVTAQKVMIIDADQAEPIQITPLPTAEEIDKSQFIYQVKVTVTGRVRPLVMLSQFFGKVPGLTEPLPVTATSTATYEDPFGLAK